MKKTPSSLFSLALILFSVAPALYAQAVRVQTVPQPAAGFALNVAVPVGSAGTELRQNGPGGRFDLLSLPSLPAVSVAPGAASSARARAGSASAALSASVPVASVFRAASPVPVAAAATPSSEKTQPKTDIEMLREIDGKLSGGVRSAEQSDAYASLDVLRGYYDGTGGGSVEAAAVVAAESSARSGLAPAGGALRRGVSEVPAPRRSVGERLRSGWAALKDRLQVAAKAVKARMAAGPPSNARLATIPDDDFFAEVTPYFRLKIAKEAFVPSKRFKKYYELEHHVEALLQQATDEQLAGLRKRFPTMAPSASDRENPQIYEGAWKAALFRDVDLLKRRMDFEADRPLYYGVSEGVEFWIQMSRMLSDADFLKIYGKYKEGYFALPKSGGAPLNPNLPPDMTDVIGRKRVADAIISMLSDRAFADEQVPPLLRYQSYLDRVQDVLGRDAKDLKSTSAKSLLDAFEKLREEISALPAASKDGLSNDIKVFLFGSAVNGRAHDGSDLDFVVYENDGGRYVKTARRGLEDSLRRAFVRVLGERFESSQLVDAVGTRDNFIEFALMLNSVTIEIDKDSVQLITRSSYLYDPKARTIDMAPRRYVLHGVPSITVPGT